MQAPAASGVAKFARLRIHLEDGLTSKQCERIALLLSAPARIRETASDAIAGKLLTWMSGQSSPDVPSARMFGPTPADLTLILRLIADIQIGAMNLRPFIDEYLASLSAALPPDLPIVKASEVKLGRELGKGSCGTVYVAQFGALEVAAKQLSVRNLRDNGRFLRELKIHHSLRHPCIVQLIAASDINEEGPRLILTELVDGGSLYQALYFSGSRMDERQIALDIALGLAYMHKCDVLHRDLRSPNVLLYAHQTRAKLCDFGLSSVLDEVAALTSHTSSAHNPAWTAPEIALDRGQATKMSDVFSLGRVLYELCTKKKPFEDYSIAQTLAALIRRQAPVIPGTVFLAWAGLVTRCTDFTPQARPTAEQAAASLRVFPSSTLMAPPADPSQFVQVDYPGKNSAVQHLFPAPVSSGAKNSVQRVFTAPASSGDDGDDENPMIGKDGGTNNVRKDRRRYER